MSMEVPVRAWLQRTVAVVLASLVGVGSALVPSGARCTDAGVPVHVCCCRAAAQAAAGRAACAAQPSSEPDPEPTAEPTSGGCCSRPAPEPTPVRCDEAVRDDDSGCRCELRAPAAPGTSARLVVHTPPAAAVLVVGLSPAPATINFVPAAPDPHSKAPPESTPRAPRGPPHSSFGSIA
jgi:hypothetical protein